MPFDAFCMTEMDDVGLSEGSSIAQGDRATFWDSLLSVIYIHFDALF